MQTRKQRVLLGQALPPPGLKSGCWLSTGQGGGGKSPAARLEEKEEALQRSARHTQDAPVKDMPISCTIYGEKRPSEAPGEGTEPMKACQRPSPGALHEDRSLASPRPQPQGQGPPFPGTEGRPGKRPYSPAAGEQKKPMDVGPASTASPSSANPARATYNPGPCGLGRGSCHVANLLNTLAQKNQNLDQEKRSPEVTCQVRKKTRTLYRSGKSLRWEETRGTWCQSLGTWPQETGVQLAYVSPWLERLLTSARP